MFNVKRYFITIPIAKEGNLTLGKDYKTVGAELTKTEYQNLDIFKDRVKVDEFQTEKVELFLLENPNLEYSKLDTETPAKEKTEKVDTELLKLQKEYVKVIGKKISPKYQNNKDWLKEKISEAKADLNNDGKLDKKDASIAGKVLNKFKK